MTKFPHHRNFLHLAAGVGALIVAATFALLVQPGWSQTPRSIRFILPFPAGGPASVLARLMGDHIQSTRNVSVIVENRPGGAGSIGAEAVARAAADGSTLLIHNPSIILNPHLRKTNYDPFNSFDALCRITDVPLFIAVSSASPYRTLRDLIEDARKNPGKLSLAALAATPSHLGFTLLKQKANVDITFVPFPGTAPIITALLGGHITAMADNYGGMAEQVNAGKMRPLATLSRARIAALNDIPTAAEAGYPGIEMESWFGAFAPTNLKNETRLAVTALILSAIRTPDIRSKIEPLGLYPSGLCGSAFSGSLRENYETFGAIIRSNNIQAE